jgi:hypothetical protein
VSLHIKKVNDGGEEHLKKVQKFRQLSQKQVSVYGMSYRYTQEEAKLYEMRRRRQQKVYEHLGWRSLLEEF